MFHHIRAMLDAMAQLRYCTGHKRRARLREAVELLAARRVPATR